MSMTTEISKKSPINASPYSARDLKAHADLVGYASRFTRLRRYGRQFRGLCPLHSERHPSFYVHPEKQVFHCFGCGTGGDVVAFVLRLHSCEFHFTPLILAACPPAGAPP